MEEKLFNRKVLNYFIYTSIGIAYGMSGTNGAGTSGILVIPIILLTILIFVFDLAFTFLGQFVFKSNKQLLYALLTPQIVGLLIFIALKFRDKYIIDYDLDIIIWGFLILTSILNCWTYFKIKKLNRVG